MITLVFLCFVVAGLMLVSGKLLKTKYSYLVASIPFLLFLYFTTYIPEIVWGRTFIAHLNWIPSVGLNIDFRIDGLSLLFALLITGIGTLVYVYAANYLKGHKFISRFYCYLTLFMAAMLGVVLSDNVLSLFLFWELTSISSFFLIGFDNENEDARKSALTALGITGLGGFLLLAGFIILGAIAGTYSIKEMLLSSEVLKQSSEYHLILILIFAGAFTKSAQFPFHFWLPGAMKAPTPVSAYLHSATMVKAGIYLLARFSPVLGNSLMWQYTLLIVGATTMLYAAINSLFRTDLKGILAYSTIASLGTLVMLIGIGSETAIIAFTVFIIAHALYKAAMFMVTGIIDHHAHTRDVTQLAGLRKKMPKTAMAAIVAALSGAGVPLLFGFISKELIYESTLHLDSQFSIALTAVTVIANVCILYAGFQAGIRPFVGNMPENFSKINKVSPLLWMPPLFLSALSLLFGIFPEVANELIVKYVVHNIYNQPVDFKLGIWHGFNTVLMLSGVTIVAGVVLYFIFKPTPKAESFVKYLSVISPEQLIHKLVKGFKYFSMKYTKTLHNGYLRVYLMTIILFFIGLVGYRLFAEVPLRINTEDLSEFKLYELVIFAIMVTTIIVTIFTKSRLTSVASLGILGYSICLLFVFYGAPDLAMTQFTIDTLTVVLFVLVLFKLPSFLTFNNRVIQLRDAVISIAFGGLISLITLQALVAPADKEISKYYAENAYLLAKGKNVVNVILVDFRGVDTLIETIVLTIAALGVYSLLKLRVKSSEKE